MPELNAALVADAGWSERPELIFPRAEVPELEEMDYDLAAVAEARPSRRRPLGRLRKNTIVIAHSDSEVQLGLDERWAVRICGLDRAETTWLQDVAYRRHIPALTSARRLRLDRDRLTALVGVLDRAGYWQAERPRRSRIELRAPGDGLGDVVALGYLRSDNLGRRTLERRAEATVAILDSGRLGAAVARHLATAGIGRLVLPDQQVVQFADLGLGGYQRSHLGKDRFDCMELQLRRCSTTIVQRDGEPDLVVAIEQDVPRRRTWTRLMGEAIPHLILTPGEAELTVGPFVLPGTSGCANCLHLHRTDADPNWPDLSDQLSRLPERPVETTLAAIGAALAAGQVLAAIDGGTPAAADSLLRIRLPQAVPEAIPAPVHPACACHHLRWAA